MRRTFSVKLLTAAALLTVALLPAACSDDSASPDDKYASFDRKGMLQHLGSNVITASYAELAGKADSLAAQAEAFSQQPDAAGLSRTQGLWLRTANAYKRCEPYQFGPVYEQMLPAQLDYWPARPTNIENLLSNSATIDEALLEQQGTTVKGLAALEYVLYSRAGGNAAVLGKLSAGGDAARRRAYLLAMARHLRTKAHLAHSLWQGGYLATYAQADGQDVAGSINLTCNALFTHLDVIKNTKVGVPAGKKDGTVQPTAVEAYQSDASLTHILNNLTGVERLFTGAGPAGGSGPGFNAFLDHLGAQHNGQPLSAAILAQLQDCRSKALALGTPSLAVAVTQNPAGVDALYTSLKQLLVLLKVDMVSELGVTLTFNDNDGD